jgi:hypothetical protein
MPARFPGSVVTLLCALSCAAEQSILLLPIDAEWRYHATGAEPAPFGVWTLDTYDDSSWPVGRALLGAETNKYPAALNTALPLTNSATNFIITYYFRTRFMGPTNTTGLLLRAGLMVDDGVAFYLNGWELGRVRLNPSAAYSTFGQFQYYETYYELLDVPSHSLREGENVLAAEVHQQGLASSDVLWGMSLHAIVPDPVQITKQPELLGGVLAQPSTFRVEVSGTAPRVQWFKDGVALSGATNAVFTVFNSTTNFNGTYYVRVTNGVSSTLSSNLVVSMAADTNGPVLIKAELQETGRVLLTFSEPIDMDIARNPLNYQLGFLENTNPVAFTSVLTSPVAVRLNGVTPWFPQSNYVVAVSGLVDRTGQTMAGVARTNVLVFRSARNVVRSNDAWRFYRDPLFSDMSRAWPTLALDDSQWLGPDPAPFASVNHTNPVRNTTVDLVAPTYYFRRTFYVEEHTPVARARIRYSGADAAVFYLNGAPVTALGLPPNPTFNMLATNFFFSSPIPDVTVSNLVHGTNLLAVEMHQDGRFVYEGGGYVYAPDLYFWCELDLAFQSGPLLPPLLIRREADNVRLEWRDSSHILEGAFDLRGPWAELAAGTNAHVLPSGPGRRFFRLKL